MRITLHGDELRELIAGKVVTVPVLVDFVDELLPADLVLADGVDMNVIRDAVAALEHAREPLDVLEYTVDKFDGGLANG